jgi:ketosteroid isomerase-like protein
MTDNYASSEKGKAEEVIKNYFSALEDQDKIGLMRLFTEDSVIELPFSISGVIENGYFGKFKGLEELDIYFSGITKNFKSIKVSELNVSLVNNGKSAFVEFRSDCELSNGRIYRNRYVMRFDLDNNKIVHAREYHNPIPIAYAFERPIAGRYKVDILDYPATNVTD